jgi:hypothetical protein
VHFPGEQNPHHEQGEAMDNLNMDGLSIYERLIENPKVRLAAALALGIALGSGATWATLRSERPKSARAAMVEQRRVENRAPENRVQVNATVTNKRPTTKKVSLKVALKECDKIKNKSKRTACIARTKKAYAKRTSSTTKRTSSAKPVRSVKPVTNARTVAQPRQADGQNAQQIASARTSAEHAQIHAIGVTE